MLNHELSLTNYQRRQEFQLVISVGTLLLLVAVSEFVGWWKPVRSLGEGLIKPALESSRSFVFILETPYRVAVKSYNGVVKIQDLELRHSEALARLGQLEGLEEENLALKELIENTDRKAREVVVSVPVVSHASPAISGGEEAGIASGNLVLASQTLVGIVESVSSKFATVRLLTQTDQYPVVAKTSSGVEGIVIGDGRRVILTEVAADASLTIGEKVLTLGQPGIERDIFIGTISQVIKEPASPVKRAVVEQLVQFNEARVVEVYK